MLRVKLERLKRGVNQKIVGRLTRIPQPSVSQIENGRLRPSAAQLRRLSAFYRVPPADLLREAPEPRP